jgi:hypothetical protein
MTRQVPVAANQAWALDFVHDRLLGGSVAGSRIETGGIVAAGLATVAYAALFLAAGLGRVQRPGLAGVASPALLVPGAIVAD